MREKASCQDTVFMKAHPDTNPPEGDVDLHELFGYLKTGKLAFLVGAGISKNEPSCLPLWNELVLSIVQALVGKLEAHKFTEEHLQKLEHIEVLVQLLHEQLGEAAYETLRIALGSKVWNPIHLFLSWAITQYNAKVLTTNVDVLIETSGQDVLTSWSNTCRTPIKPNELMEWLYARHGALFKLHGTIQNIDTIRVAVNDIFIGLSSGIKQCLTKILKSHHLLVLGYRGADEFDINPVLFRHRPDVKLFWLFHQQPTESKREAPTLLLNRLQRLNANIATAETTEFVRQLCLLALQDNKENMPSELIHWATSSLFSYSRSSALTCSSWDYELQAWADKIRTEDRLRVWARILEYVGEYGKATHVYQSCLDSMSEKPSLKRAETLFRLAWLRRRADPSLALLNLFDEAAKGIDDVIRRHPDAKPEGLLLKGAVLHQKGRALQDANDFDEALKNLVSAQSLRQEINDHVGVAFTRFQRFMLGERAQQVLGESVNLIENFAPGWRRELAPELEIVTRTLRRKGNIRDFTVMNHNIAFLYQFIVEKEMIASKAWDDALSLVLRIIRRYYVVKRLRERLYEPRECAMTYARLAEAHKLKGLILSNLGNKRGKRQACKCGLCWAKKAIEVFRQLPDPERIRQVERVISEIQTIYDAS